MAITDERVAFGASVSAGTTNNLWTMAPGTSDQEILVHARCVARAGSGAGAEVAGYERIATFRVKSGTLSQVGGAAGPHTAENDTAWNLTLDVSGSAIRVRGTADSANSTIFEGIVEVMIRR
jgi:hypothetical protein